MSDLKEMIRQANEVAVNKMKNAQPYWADIKPAHEVLGIDKYTLLHAGPPIAWEEMCGPMRGAIIAVLKYEGLAENDEEALALAGSGKIKYEPCHHHNAVGPMTGVTSYSMPMICVLNKENGNYAYSTINEGTGKGIRFGSCGQDTVDQLVWLEKVLGPALKDVVHTMGGINLKMIISQALAMGDELHMRNNAATNLFVKTIAETLCEVVESRAALTQIMHFLTWNNDQFFLNFAMAANKACADAAHGIEHSTMVTAMARNGVNIGIRVSGLGDCWFTAPAADVAGAYFPGYSAEDANKDIGDSAIMETGGIGGMAIATAPAIVRFLGAGKYQDAVNYTNNMYEITLSEQDQYAMPDMDFRGSPIGIDILKVVETGISPIINTAIACKRPGVGMIGAGISKAPLEMFEEAMVAFGEAHGLQ